MGRWNGAGGKFDPERGDKSMFEGEIISATTNIGSQDFFVY